MFLPSPKGSVSIIATTANIYSIGYYDRCKFMFKIMIYYMFSKLTQYYDIIIPIIKFKEYRQISYSWIKGYFGRFKSNTVDLRKLNNSVVDVLLIS